MKTPTKWILLAVIGLGLFTGLSSCEKSANEVNEQAQAGFFLVNNEGLTDIVASGISDYFVTDSGSLTESEKEGLKLMREEEKLARDVYEQLSYQHDLPIFGNISNSEATHFEAVGKLLDYFAIEDPAMEEAGSFNNSELQSLYDSLVTKGNESLIAALEVGATVEEIDILDLGSLIQETGNEDIVMVYENLLRGSRNHLRAFNRLLERNGVDYSPAYLDEESFDAIVSSEMERGGYGGCYANGNGNKNGNRNGKGNGQGSGQGQGKGRGYRGGN
ncbi:MAG: DUF2202 domain-containing protein [Bacteroidales bacterium]|nr:DUF2202 domain-containing protein [Bacteroidales bacterium]